DREDAVSAIAEAVFRNGDVGRVPERHAVPALTAAALAQSFDDVAFDARASRAVNIDAEQVSFQAIVFDHRTLRGLLEKDPRIHGLEIAAGLPDGDVADGALRRCHSNDIAGPAAAEHGTGSPGQNKSTVNPDPTLVNAGRQLDDVTFLRTVQHRLKRLV